MSLLVLIILATVFYTLFEIFSAQSGGKIDSNLGPSIFNGLGAIIPIVSYIVYKIFKKEVLIPTTAAGVWYSVLAGVSIALFSILFVKIFEKGGEVSYAIPLIYGGSVVLASATGIFLFKETVSAMQVLGIIAVILGIGLIVVSKMGSVAV